MQYIKCLKIDYNNKFLQILLVILPLIGTLSIDMYLPAYHSMATTFKVSANTISHSIAIFLVGFAVGQLIYGPLADRFGARKPLLGGLILFCLSSIVCILVPNYTIFLIGRLLQAVGASSCIILASTIVTDIYSASKRTSMLALILASKIISPMIAPLIGGYIVVNLHWQIIFMVLATVGFFMLLASWILIPKITYHKAKVSLSPKQQILNLKLLLGNKFFLGNTLSLAFVYAAIYAWITSSPNLLIANFHVAPQHFGLYYMFPALGVTIGAILVAKFSSIKYLIKHSIIALCLIMLGIVAFVIMRNYIVSPMAMIMIITSIFFGCGMSRPLLNSGALEPFPQISGFCSGIIGFIQTMFGAAMSYIVGMIYHIDISMILLLLFIPVLLAMLSYAYAMLGRKTVDLS